MFSYNMKHILQILKTSVQVLSVKYEFHLLKISIYYINTISIWSNGMFMPFKYFYKIK